MQRNSTFRPAHHGRDSPFPLILVACADFSALAPSMRAVLLQVIWDGLKVMDSLCVAAYRAQAAEQGNIATIVRRPGVWPHRAALACHSGPTKDPSLSRLLPAHNAANVPVHWSWKVCPGLPELHT